MFGSLVQNGRTLLRGLLHLVYPGVCPFCEVLLAPEQEGCCPACRAALTTDPFPACPRCAATIGPWTENPEGCSWCRSKSFHFEKVLRLGPHEGRLRDAILRIKYSDGATMAELLGKVWAARAAERLQAVGAGVVIPVPLHWRRRWERGYNQSELLARALAVHLKLPCRPRWLRRVRNTLAQTGQSPSVRRANVRGAFQARRRVGLAGRTVLLVDDVMTTGSTCSEAARALKQAGAAHVIVAVLSRWQR